MDAHLYNAWRDVLLIDALSPRRDGQSSKVSGSGVTVYAERLGQLLEIGPGPVGSDQGIDLGVPESALSLSCVTCR